MILDTQCKGTKAAQKHMLEFLSALLESKDQIAEDGSQLVKISQVLLLTPHLDSAHAKTGLTK